MCSHGFFLSEASLPALEGDGDTDPLSRSPPWRQAVPAKRVAPGLRDIPGILNMLLYLALARLDVSKLVVQTKDGNSIGQKSLISLYSELLNVVLILVLVM